MIFIILGGLNMCSLVIRREIDAYASTEVDCYKHIIFVLGILI